MYIKTTYFQRIYRKIDGCQFSQTSRTDPGCQYVHICTKIKAFLVLCTLPRFQYGQFLTQNAVSVLKIIQLHICIIQGIKQGAIKSCRHTLDGVTNLHSLQILFRIFKMKQLTGSVLPTAPLKAKNLKRMFMPLFYKI